MRIQVALVVLAISTCGCGSGRADRSPTAPLQPPSPPVTIDIVGVNGALSFSPNPAVVPAGHNLAWRNTDGQTHRIVFDDGEVDTGNVPPGVVSATMGFAKPGRYHCTIHPEMVGMVEGGL